MIYILVLLSVIIIHVSNSSITTKIKQALSLYKSTYAEIGDGVSTNLVVPPWKDAKLLPGAIVVVIFNLSVETIGTILVIEETESAVAAMLIFSCLEITYTFPCTFIDL